MQRQSSMSAKKYIPGSDADSGDIFMFPYTTDADTIHFIKEHGRIMFIIRGPPGTGKDSLTRMLIDSYPESSVCSADAYFSDTFNKSKRDSTSLAASHEFCHRKVLNACIKGTHPIIVKNTHMKKSELQKYLDFAAEYNYTVIMAVTIHKMEVTPEILAQSNTKGLNVDYFRKRLRQWQEVAPVNTGWFLNLDDASYLLNQVQTTLDHLLGDGKFCRVLDAYQKEDLLKHYEARKLLYCVAACGDNNMSTEIRSYYLSDIVKEHYGQCFRIVIQGYIVTPSYIAAIVCLNETMKKLLHVKSYGTYSAEEDVDFLVHSLNSFQLGDNFEKHCATTELNKAFNTSGKTNGTTEDEEYEVINTDNIGFMILAESEKQTVPPMKVIASFSTLLSDAADEDGVIGSYEFQELEGGYSLCRLKGNAWLIRPPNSLSFQTIFTGLYI